MMTRNGKAMTKEECTVYHQAQAGLEPGTVYDPHLHEEIGLQAFGEVGADNSMSEGGQHLRPELDLISAAFGQGVQSDY